MAVLKGYIKAQIDIKEVEKTIRSLKGKEIGNGIELMSVSVKSVVENANACRCVANFEVSGSVAHRFSNVDCLDAVEAYLCEKLGNYSVSSDTVGTSTNRTFTKWKIPFFVSNQ